MYICTNIQCTSIHKLYIAICTYYIHAHTHFYAVWKRWNLASRLFTEADEDVISIYEDITGEETKPEDKKYLEKNKGISIACVAN